jgi:uncharacterized protein (DUF486 family)
VIRRNRDEKRTHHPAITPPGAVMLAGWGIAFFDYLPQVFTSQ